ncbi:MAG: HEAT repeat domain-containing protein, partial [Planctomycetota bacterium]
MARYVLERIPGAAADKALRGALSKTSGKVKVGIINSLGARGDKKSVKQLGKLLADGDKEIVEASMSALGKIGGREAAGALSKVRGSIAAELRGVWADAYLACGDKFLAEGDMSWAVRIYMHMYSAAAPVPVQAAALRGMVTAMPGRADTMLIGVLKGDDEQMRAVAVGLLREVPSPELVEAVTGELVNLSVMGQVQVLSALGDRGDRSALGAVVDATGSREAEVRVAAFGALGALGDASHVKMLARAAASTKDAEQEAAREALYRLRGLTAEQAAKVGGVTVNQVILSSIGESEPKVKVELIRSIGRRNVTAGVGTLLRTARDPQQEVRLESLKALKTVAGEKDLAALIELLIDARSETERSEAENTAAAVARRIEDESRRADKVLAVLPSVTQSQARSSLLAVLGKIGGSDALGGLRKALADEDVEVRISAIRALSDWPTPEPVKDLGSVARKSADQKERVLALRGFVRLIGLDSERPTERRVAMYKESMNLASSVAERRAVLSGLGNLKSLEALQMTADYLDDSTLRREAEAAVVRIAESTHASHPKQTKAVLQEIVRLSRNESLRQRAQEIIEQIEKYEDYITAWEVSGPYSRANTTAQEVFKIGFAPEEGDGEKAQWRMMAVGTDRDRPWLLELDKAIGGEYCAGYLRTKVRSPKEQRVRLQVGSNDGIKVWLNGEVVHSNNILRSVSRDEDIAEVTLREGWNVLMMKISQSRGQWSACARFVGLDGGKLKGLKVAACGSGAPGKREIDLVGDDFSMWGEKTGTWQVVGEAMMNSENEKLLA